MYSHTTLAVFYLPLTFCSTLEISLHSGLNFCVCAAPSIGKRTPLPVSGSRIKGGITKGRIGRKWRPGASRSRSRFLRIDRRRRRRVSFLKSLDVRILAPADPPASVPLSFGKESSSASERGPLIFYCLRVAKGMLGSPSDVCKISKVEAEVFALYVLRRPPLTRQHLV